MRVIAALALCTMASSAVGQSLLYKVDLEERIDRSELIVEGRVIGQRAFWNQAKTLIHTASRIAVYRVFKGKAEQGVVEVITPGGVIGHTANAVYPSLELRPGDVGVLFLESDYKTRGTKSLRPYASVQGFVRYDEARGGAADVFDSYLDITNELHSRIQTQVGQRVQVLRDYTVPARSVVVALPKVVPVITSVAPAQTTAGTRSEITITGTGFEAYDGGTNSAVFFPNADDGGQTLRGAGDVYITSWTDTEIKVDVPTAAGTGPIMVQSASQLRGTSPNPLTIDYNQIEIYFDVDGVLAPTATYTISPGHHPFVRQPSGIRRFGV